ncbi:MAG TPA: Eco57I restriction-modification methylase domain-containing protein [Tepidisphaeraceae bacterium]|jgi:adenine-specific DNA-methyltransferase|nr:Eco57I restriction-modification methylase domain-containing protein [Tepidisphaeraceae bacterium]
MLQAVKHPSIKEKGVNRLIDEVDQLRVSAFQRAELDHRSLLGQYSTPPPIATLMASFFKSDRTDVRLLDPGAGVGSLTSAYIARLCNQQKKPKSLQVTAYEIDPKLKGYLGRSFAICGHACAKAGISFDGRISGEDFIASAVALLETTLFGNDNRKFDAVILNPPYKKINSVSEHRRLLRRVGIETSNLYTAFLALSVLLLDPGGQLVAITPRSFCNGPYFRPFRQLFLREMSIRHVHLFESRTEAFSEDEVLQENIIIHAIKTKQKNQNTNVSTSLGPTDTPSVRVMTPKALVRPNDPQQFIHIIANDAGSRATDLMGRLSNSLDDIGLSVSTGPVVDFRCKSCLKAEPAPGSVPLIYPSHFADGWVKWPRLGHKKPNACLLNDRSRKWLVPSSVYVLTKRFSAKEEARRIVAAVFDPDLVQCELVAFENHLNYFHEKGRGIPMNLAKGLAVYLNSTVTDTYFRQFNGHTQVNASDLRSLKFPGREELEKLGQLIGDRFPGSDEIDHLVESRFPRWLKNRE